MAIREGIVPPTIGYKEPDPECDLDITPNKAVEMPINVAISNSLGFGGQQRMYPDQEGVTRYYGNQ